MSDLSIYIPLHGYSNDDPVYVSWLNDIYYVADKNDYEFKLVTSLGGTTYLQWSEDITSGYIREVDSATAALTVSGLDHLEGEGVYVTSGGRTIGLFTVVSGSVSVPSFIFTYQVGLPYKMKIRTMRLSVPQQDSTLQTRIKRIHSTVVRYLRSRLGKAGQEYDSVEYLQDIEAEFSTESADTPENNRLTTGGFTEDAYTVITSDDPVPFTVLSTIVSFEVEEQR